VLRRGFELLGRAQFGRDRVPEDIEAPLRVGTGKRDFIVDVVRELHLQQERLALASSIMEGIDHALQACMRQ
jgi:hypothetical protein